MTAGLAMTVSYAAVGIVLLILVVCMSIMTTESRLDEQEKGVENEMDEGIACLTVVADKRKGVRTKSLKGMTYSLSENEVLGSGGGADTVLKHPAVEKKHVSLTYRKPGKMLVKALRGAAVSTSRKGGELMDGDRLILGADENNRLELQLSFLKHADIEAAKNNDSDGWDDFIGRRRTRR